MIVNSGSIDEERLKRYRQEDARPVRTASNEIRAMGMRLIEEDLVSDTDVAWHEPDKLAQVIIDIIKSHKERNIRSMTF